MKFRKPGLMAATAGVVAMLGAPALAKKPKITEAEILAAQDAWAAGIVAIGKANIEGGDYTAVARQHIADLYAYGESTVLFKPTKAAADQFRGSRDEALSYFVRGGIAEDQGFAINPWTAVRFENEDLVIDSDSALAMGNYFFTDPDGNEVKVEYSFGYIRGADGRLRINLHHSSLPFAAN